MVALSFDLRTEVQDRLNGGQNVAGIAAEMKIAKKTVYRLKQRFQLADGSFQAVAASRSTKQALSRANLVEISQWLLAEPKLTISELRRKLVSEGLFDSISSVPDQSTLYRQLKKLNFTWRRPVYKDPKLKTSDVLKFERCSFRKAQDHGQLDPTKLLNFDESNFHVAEQPRRAWGPAGGSGPVLEQPKGKQMRNSVLCTVGFALVNGAPKCFIHGVFIPPRKSFRPLKDEVEPFEIQEGERDQIRAALSMQIINSLSTAGLKGELTKLGIRAPENSAESMKATLVRVLQRGSREGELRVRGKGRPSAGGAVIAPTGDSRMTSDYLYNCLLPYLRDGTLLNADGSECELKSSDEGIAGCPSFGKREFQPDIKSLSLLWDSAPSHQPTNFKTVSPFAKYVSEVLGMDGLIHTPPLTPSFAPIELIFSLLKRHCRKTSPKTVPELIACIRERVATISGKTVMGLFQKCGYRVPGQPEHKRPVDPNLGHENRCTLPADAKFLRREGVACFDEAGKLRREKKRGHATWSKYDEMPDGQAEELTNISVSKKRGVLPQKRARVEECDQPPVGAKARWTGIGEPPADANYGDHSHLISDSSDNAAVEGILAERVDARGKPEFLVKWVGFDESHNEWLPEVRFTAGFNTMIHGWKQRNKRKAEGKQLKESAEAAQQADIVPPYKQNRKPKVGQVVAIFAGNKKDDVPLFMGKVLEISSKKGYLVHWWSAGKVDGTWSPEFRKPRGAPRKGHGGPYTDWIDKKSVIDVIKGFDNKNKGKIEKPQLTELLRLAKDHRKKK